MFDPYAHSPLVAESSVDKYQLILPMQYVVNAVILKDFLKNSDNDPSLIHHHDAKGKNLNGPKLPKETMFEFSFFHRYS